MSGIYHMVIYIESHIKKPWNVCTDVNENSCSCGLRNVVNIVYTANINKRGTGASLTLCFYLFSTHLMIIKRSATAILYLMACFVLFHRTQRGSTPTHTTWLHRVSHELETGGLCKHGARIPSTMSSTLSN